MSDDRYRVLVCAVVRNDENTEQGMEDMREVAIKLFHALVVSKVVVPRRLCCSEHGWKEAQSLRGLGRTLLKTALKRWSFHVNGKCRLLV